MPDLTLTAWHEQVGFLPPLLDHLTYDLVSDGYAPVNALAEAIKTLDPVGRVGRNAYGSRVPYRTQHAVQDALTEWTALEFLAGARRSFPLDEKLACSLDEAASSMEKATKHEPVGKKDLWKHKGWQLPAYIQHIANDLREKRGMDESRAIATAIAVVKRWAAGGGKVKPDTRAAAAKAVAEWEKLKAKAHANKTREAMLVNAASRLTHAVRPMANTATFATRYGNRLVVVEGLIQSLAATRPLSVQTAMALLEAEPGTNVGDLAEQLAERKFVLMVLMEALGYGSTPIRAHTGPNKGKFHGMHGVEKAVRKRTHAKDDGDEHPVLAAIASGGKLREAEMIAEAAPTLAPTAPAGAGTSAAWSEELHPRAHGGQFGSKGGEQGAAAGGSGSNGGGTSTAAPLAAAIQAADPQFTKDMAATSAFAATHPAGSTATSQNAVNTAGQQIQNIGYDNSPSGISQFQKDEGIPVTGKLDDTTLATVQTVYTQNARYAASRVPDFTGIKGAGARSSGGARGRSTLGKTASKKINEAFDGLVESTLGFDSPLFRPNFDPQNPDDESRQPGGDDFDLDEVPTLPPNLRESEGVSRCATCVHFSRAGWVTSRGVYGACMAYTYPVDKDDLCDDWLTLTPPDATLRVFEAQVREAEESGDGFEISAARAKLRRARERATGEEPLDFHPASQALFEALYALKIEERDFTPQKRKALAAKGKALKGGAFPVASLSDLDNAIQAYGRAKPGDRPALKRLLAKMARKLNASGDVKSRIAGLGA